MKYISAAKIAIKFKVQKNTVINRFKKLGIEPVEINKKFYYSIEDSKMFEKTKQQKNIITTNERFSVIEYFLSNRNNSSLDLTKVFFIHQRRIDRIISDYLNNDKCIIISSKMNKL